MMKKAILEEHDTRKLSLIQGPSIIINRLIQLQFAYDKYLDEKFWEMDERPYTAEKFVQYINDIVLADDYQKVKILELDLKEDDRNLPKLKLW